MRRYRVLSGKGNQSLITDVYRPRLLPCASILSASADRGGRRASELLKADRAYTAAENPTQPLYKIFALSRWSVRDLTAHGLGYAVLPDPGLLIT